MTGKQVEEMKVEPDSRDVVVSIDQAKKEVEEDETRLIPEMKLPVTKDEVKRDFGVEQDEVESLRAKFGANIIKEEKRSKLWMLISQFTGTMPVMIMAAMILSGVLEDWIDFAIIGAMLIINAAIGFHHESAAANALEEVEDQLSANETVQVFRKIKGATLEVDAKVEDLVVGDLVYIRAGDVIPADGEWIFGDKLYVNEASLTGETRPRKVPGDDKRRDILKGSTLVQGEGFARITAVGENTIMGEASAAMNTGGKVSSPLEQAIQGVVNLLVGFTLVVVFFILIVQLAIRDASVRDTLLSVTGLVVASVPVALPLVVSVTLAIGATTLARKGAIISHLSAMQDLASMDVLCSDKTGTLTTAKMTINLAKIWVNEAMKRLSKDFRREDVVELAALCSTLENAKKNEIERSVFEALAEVKMTMSRIYDSYKCDGTKGDVYHGFNANVKRTFCTVTRNKDADAGLPEHLKITKGLLTKVLDCNDPDDTGDVKWTVLDYKNVGPHAKQVDEDFGKSGYKTLAVGVDMHNEGPDVKMMMAGILPIKDPPRESTMETIKNIRAALINVKMVTGDHENIARNLAKDIKLGQNFLVHEDLWPASAARNERVAKMDGIAQVTPKDKHEVVAILQDRGHVVGMCGDGVNDAPALSLANVGFAVPGATQAARNAADIVLTEGNDGKNEGLRVIYDAIVISREIFQRIQAYVLYRFASTVLIILFLAILTFVFSENFPTLYVILFAIINDVTVTPIASDHVVGTKGPSVLNMFTVLGLSCVLGSILGAQTILTYWGNPFNMPNQSAEEVSTYLQLSISSQFLIFICRTEKPFFMTVAPHWVLLVACVVAQLVVSIWCGFGVVVETSIPVDTIVYIWLYSFAGLLVSDFFKCEFYHLSDPVLYPNYYYSWMFTLCSKKATTDIEDMEEAWAVDFPERRTLTSAKRNLTGFYIQRGHVGNLTQKMKSRIRNSIRKNENVRMATMRAVSAMPYKTAERRDTMKLATL
uniref:Cation-transporting P-type ATPase N-terminal domain-containing protein n=1 Tax=Lotharella globosa TaxID=91324 RepID=A0A7S3YNX8_9EUKA|mmetsp:Transcript_32794/g.63267  ORF Transcript_32794/g.63267 Transcript_32794/m.63267 type:complete len:994 (+) Transcript_32794:88-3069(+)